MWPSWETTALEWSISRGMASCARSRQLKEPQGIAYLPSTDSVYVANGGDGSLTVFDPEFSRISSIPLGDDADNLRVDPVSQHLFVGYGKGLAEVDPASGKIVADVALPGHPEGFQLKNGGSQIFINVPDAQEIAVVDRDADKVVAHWRLSGAGANFPMALDPNARELVSVFRSPPRIGVFAESAGPKRLVSRRAGDADDVFVDAKRQRLYVVCGEGAIDIFSRERGTYQPLESVPTVAGARTGYSSQSLTGCLSPSGQHPRKRPRSGCFNRCTSRRHSPRCQRWRRHQRSIPL